MRKRRDGAGQYIRPSVFLWLFRIVKALSQTSFSEQIIGLNKLSLKVSVFAATLSLFS